MVRLKTQEPAKQILSWITHAKTPLTTMELRHALAVEIGESKLDKENLPEIEDIVSVCAGLVTVDEKSDIIRVIHYRAHEYFERTHISWFPSAQRDITMTCVAYLSFDTFEAGFCQTDEELTSRLQLNPLYTYASRNWGHHARIASVDMGQLILGLLENEPTISGSSQAMMASGNYPVYSQYVPRRMTGAHLAGYFGLSGAMMALLKNGHDPNFKDSWC